MNRSVVSCDGGLLLIDASQGIQAQTLANFRLAKAAGLDLIPVLSKIDLSNQLEIDSLKTQLVDVFGFDASVKPLETSAKKGLGIDEVLEAISTRVRPPTPAVGTQLRAHLLDCWFNVHRGVISLVKVVEGEIRTGDTVHLVHGRQEIEIQETGVVTPALFNTGVLRAGQVGYIVTGLRNSKDVVLGDTLCSSGNQNSIEMFEALDRNHPMVFASIYPSDSCTFFQLRGAVEKLLLNDASVTTEIESSDALGMGFQCGFNGILHMEVFCDRLRNEFNVDVIVTSPTVPYKVHMKGAKEGEEPVMIQNPREFPEAFDIDSVEEPFVNALIICRETDIGDIHELARTHRGSVEEMDYISEQQIQITACMPLSEVVVSFYNKLKSITSGHGTVDFKDGGFRFSDLVKVDLKINGKIVDALSIVCERKLAPKRGRVLVQKLKDTLDRQNFEIVIQAMIGTKVQARQRLAPFRKDVLMKGSKLVGGGDESRKNKLLQKQKEGKKMMKTVGVVSIPQEAFLTILKLDD